MICPSTQTITFLYIRTSCVKNIQSGSRVTQSGAELLQSGSWVDNKSGRTTLASAHVLCLDLLLCVWLHISGEQNCCQEIRRGVVYRLIGVKMDIKDVNNFNLWTKELECNYWSTYTKSGIGGVPVTSLHRDPIEVDNRSLGAEFSNNIKYKRNYIIKWVFSIIWHLVWGLNLRLNNIFCCLSNSAYKHFESIFQPITNQVSDYLW